MQFSLDFYVEQKCALKFYECPNPAFAALFVVGIMCQLTASLIISACLLNIYHHRPDVPPPACIRTLINGCLAPLLCIRCGKLSKCGNKKQYSPSSETQNQTITIAQVHSDTQEVTLPEYIRTYITEKIERDRSNSIADFNKSEWQNIARVLERLSFIGFAIFIIIISTEVFTALNQ